MKFGGYALVLVLVALCPRTHAQELPDTPSLVIERGAVGETFLSPAHRSPRGHKKLLAFVGVLAFEVATDIYDVSETEKGLKAGVANESFTWLVGSKPSVRALYAQQALVTGIIVSPSVIGYLCRKPELFYGFLSVPVVMGFKHIRAGNQWKALLAGHRPTGSEFGP
jgi:hypothetical protein